MQGTWETWVMLAGQWWFWVVWAIGVIGIWYMYWRLFARREYKKINGKLCVRHGIGNWDNLEDHMTEKHPGSISGGKG